MKPKTGWVTDDEENKGNTSEEEMSDQESNAAIEKSPAWWKKIILSLPRMSVRSEELPRIGEQCLVMKGKAGDDEGQVGVVTDRKRCMVEIAFQGPKGDIRRKLKRPGTLIFLKKGVTVKQDRNGTMWVQPERKRSEERR
jgi:hypothetical protein